MQEALGTPHTGSIELPTPINIAPFLQLLDGYTQSKVGYLARGFTRGFSLGFQGHIDTFEANNLPSATRHPRIIQDKITKEVQENRLLGPFAKSPFQRYIVSPLGLIPKKIPGEFRLIQHLSYPTGQSVNDGIPQELSSVKYQTIDQVIDTILTLGQNTWLMKTDIKSAFRIVPIKPEEYPLMGIKVDGKYYFNRTLPMGASSSCAIFEEISSAVEWIAREKLSIPGTHHLLDDFLLAAPSQESHPVKYLDRFLEMCDQIGLPMAPDKTEGPSTCLSFAGIELDTCVLEARLPQEKLDKCRQYIASILHKNKVTLRQLQSVIGLLNFACRVVAPGRAFLRRLINLTLGINQPYHHIRVTSGVREDLLTWQNFLQKYNGRSMFIQRDLDTADQLRIQTDASGSHGYAAIMGSEYFYGSWPRDWQQLNIVILELFPIVLAVAMWASKLANRRTNFFTDNKALVAIINSQTSRNSKVMVLIRFLVSTCLEHNISFTAHHVYGVDNIAADALSRFQLQRFRAAVPHAAAEPMSVPPHLHPVNWTL